MDLLTSKTDGWGASRPGFWDPSAWESGSVTSTQEGPTPKESRPAEHGGMLPRAWGPSFYIQGRSLHTTVLPVVLDHIENRGNTFKCLLTFKFTLNWHLPSTRMMRPKSYSPTCPA